MSTVLSVALGFGPLVVVLALLAAQHNKRNEALRSVPAICWCGHPLSDHWGENSSCRGRVKSGQTELGIQLWGRCGICPRYVQTSRTLRYVLRYGTEQRPR